MSEPAGGGRLKEEGDGGVYVNMSEGVYIHA
jgi:hypothetical protein